MYLNPKNQGWIAAFGAYRSGSTWVANVAAEIIRLSYTAKIIYSDSVVERFTPSDNGKTVVKMHIPDSKTIKTIVSEGIPVIMTVRRPEDCVVSFMEQFGKSFEDAVLSVSRCCNSIVEIADVYEPFCIRYESPSAREYPTLLNLARYIDVPLTMTQAKHIAEQYRIDRVRSIINLWTKEGRFGESPTPDKNDQDTHWHYNHVGTGEARADLVLNQNELDHIRSTVSAFYKMFYPEPNA